MSLAILSEINVANMVRTTLGKRCSWRRSANNALVRRNALDFWIAAVISKITFDNIPDLVLSIAYIIRGVILIGRKNEISEIYGADFIVFRIVLNSEFAPAVCHIAGNDRTVHGSLTA